MDKRRSEGNRELTKGVHTGPPRVAGTPARVDDDVRGGRSGESLEFVVGRPTLV